METEKQRQKQSYYRQNHLCKTCRIILGKCFVCSRKKSNTVILWCHNTFLFFSYFYLFIFWLCLWIIPSCAHVLLLVCAREWILVVLGYLLGCWGLRLGWPHARLGWPPYLTSTQSSSRTFSLSHWSFAYKWWWSRVYSDFLIWFKWMW